MPHFMDNIKKPDPALIVLFIFLTFLNLSFHFQLTPLFVIVNINIIQNIG
jgi:hypothetical protein